MLAGSAELVGSGRGKEQPVTAESGKDRPGGTVTTQNSPIPGINIPAHQTYLWIPAQRGRTPQNAPGKVGPGSLFSDELPGASAALPAGSMRA